MSSLDVCIKGRVTVKLQHTLTVRGLERSYHQFLHSDITYALRDVAVTRHRCLQMQLKQIVDVELPAPSIIYGIYGQKSLNILLTVLPYYLFTAIRLCTLWANK